MPQRYGLIQHPAGSARQTFGLPALVAMFSAILITLSALSLFFVGGVASEAADTIAIEKQNVLFENAIRDRQNLMARDQLGLARWDRSVEHVSLNFSRHFIENELVSSLWHDFGHDRSFLVGPGGRILMAALQGETDFTQRNLDPQVSLGALVELALVRHNTNRLKIDGGFSQRQVKASHVEEIAAYGFVEIDGSTMIASAMAIVPDDGAVALPDGPPVILVSARPIDASFIDDINAQLKLSGLVYSQNPNGLVPAIDVQAQTLGSFSWEIYRPGHEIWVVVVPVVVVLCGLLLAATLVLGRYIGRLSLRLETSERRNRELALRDTLSGLANRLCFDQALTNASERLAHAPFAVIASDLDRFKAVNDIHGHGAGDEVIRVVAERLRHAVGEHGLVGRMGGDEFVILVSAFRDRARLSMLAQTIIASIARPIMLPSGALVDVGISLGIAVAPEHGLSGHQIMARADRALYASKDGGRGRAVFAEDLPNADGAADGAAVNAA
ncbi:MAG: diguanylate cyclase [Rhizobium sp.]|nr:diguanylate cyclase [Rhizobium sp.]